jgi:hypothetical protein
MDKQTKERVANALLRAADSLDANVDTVKSLMDIANKSNSYKEFLDKTDGSDVLYRAHHGDGLENNIFMTDWIGHAKTYTDNPEEIDGLVFDFSDLLFVDDNVFNVLRWEYSHLTTEELKRLYRGHKHLDPTKKDLLAVKKALASDKQYSDIIPNIALNDLLIPLLQDYASKKGKNIISFLGSDYADYGGQHEFVVKDISSYPTLRGIWDSVKG